MSAMLCEAPRLRSDDGRQPTADAAGQQRSAGAGRGQQQPGHYDRGVAVRQYSRGQRGGVQQAGRRHDLPAVPGEVQRARDEGAE
ncbi:hypothetical protein [Streptomyces sp. NPDC051554]|uniref:hypothetical protein n=1 Tax=Streptomyces sp. NPDC051554 TaxID=3365656 RepID=UPI00379B5179